MGLINTLIPNASADVIGVFDEALAQLFGQAKTLKVMVNESSKLMDHPIENGELVTDHKVDNPTVLELSIIAGGPQMRSIYQQIKQMWRAGKLMTIQTKTDSYPNMAIEALPHAEDGDMYDSVMIAVSLREVRIVSAQYGVLPASKVRNPTMSSTVNKGQQQATPAPAAQEAKAKKQSVLYGVLH